MTLAQSQETYAKGPEASEAIFLTRGQLEPKNYEQELARNRAAQLCEEIIETLPADELKRFISCLKYERAEYKEFSETLDGGVRAWLIDDLENYTASRDRLLVEMGNMALSDPR